MNWISKYPFTEAPDLDAGALVALISPTKHVDQAGFALRRLGVEIRDAISYQADAGPLVILLGRIPVADTYVDQVVRKGVGVYRIDSSRVPSAKWDQEAMERCNTPKSGRNKAAGTRRSGFSLADSYGDMDTTKGRFPVNLILMESTAEIMDAQSGILHATAVERRNTAHKSVAFGIEKDNVTGGYDDSGGASRFYHRFETLEGVVDHLEKLFVGPTKITY